jgi:hypothetical protein
VMTVAVDIAPESRTLTGLFDLGQGKRGNSRLYRHHVVACA